MVGKSSMESLKDLSTAVLELHMSSPVLEKLLVRLSTVLILNLFIWLQVKGHLKSTLQIRSSKKVV